MTAWIIPSEAWRTEVLLIRETLGVNMRIACDLLKQYNSADAAFDAYTSTKDQT